MFNLFDARFLSINNIPFPSSPSWHVINDVFWIHFCNRCYFVKQLTFDLILMDIRIPVMDSYPAAQEIKDISNVSVMALTASVMKDDFERLKRDNFDAYLRKPVLKADLINELCKFLPFDQVAISENTIHTYSLTDADHR